MQKQKWLVALMVVGTVGVACGDGGEDSRTVLVDYSSDEFASAAFFNFPKKVEAVPGQTIEFRQTWTGEPHTVTGGKFTQESLKKGGAWITFFETFEKLEGGGADLPNPEDPGDARFADMAAGIKGAKNAKLAREVSDAWAALVKQGIPLPDLENPPDLAFSDVVTQIEEESDKTFSAVKFAFDDDEEIAQNMAQPCYRRTGGIPADTATPCSKTEQRQPEFNGTDAVYNSGFIPYEGVKGNSFPVKLADDIVPGTYLFYCAVHGPGQLTELQVRPKGTKIESPNDLARRARAEADETFSIPEKVYRKAVRSGRVSFEGKELKAPFAGVAAEGADHALINEFVPKDLRAKAGEPITWTMMGSDHTISFDVPKYFPILEFGTRKGVRFNPKLEKPAGGAAPIPEQEGRGVFKVDGGTYDGTGFWSSGLVGGSPYAEYTLRITKPGKYPYACLIHPPMIGTVTVT